MVWIDIILLIIALWFAYKGLRNGLVVELTSLLSLIVAIWAALKYGKVVRELLQRYLDLQGDYLPFISFVVVFLAVLIVVGLIGKVITKALNIVQLGFLNKTLGLAFSILKIGIILSLLVNGLDRVNKVYEFIPQSTINNSYFYRPLNGFAKKIYEFSDEHFDDVKQQFQEAIEEIKDTEEA